MTLARIYSCRDVEMLLAGKEISKSLLDNIKELNAVRSTWTKEWATNLVNKIDSVTEKYLGLDKKQTQKIATSTLNEISTNAIRDISFLKKQIEVDFDKKSYLKIFDSIGMPNSLDIINRGNQEELIQLLFSLKKGLTPKLKAEIAAKGTNPVLIDRLIQYADSLKEAEVSQSVLKSTTKVISEEAVVAFNDIYSEIIGICKIASTIYQDNSAKKQLFVFSNYVPRKVATKTKTDEPIVE